MKSARYYPFERNRYFYGKLLTVRDFESEQKYMNDKRRLINRLLSGSGVVCGLQVVAVDDKTISVETGVALDSSGREIVVATPVTQKLSMLDGFSNNEYAKDVYLCIAYDEKGKEPVHSIASSSTHSEEMSEYNRIQESYRLFVREEAPGPSVFGLLNLAEDISLVYSDSQVRIWQRTPRYVNPGGVLEVTIKVEKALQTANLRLSYEIFSEHFYPVDGGSTLKVSFIEPDHGQQTEYEAKFLLKAVDKSEVTGQVMIKDSVVKLGVGDKQTDIETGCVNTVQIVDGPVKERILDSYFNLTLDQYMESITEDCIYLARISLLHVGSTFMIEKVENVPFGEYIYNASVLYQLGLLEREHSEMRFTARATATELPPGDKPEVFVNYNHENNEFQFQVGVPQAKIIVGDVTTGTAEIELETNQRFGKGYFSDEIEHGLGLGPVFIHVGIEENVDSETENNGPYSEQIFYGVNEVFQKSPFESQVPPLSIGTVVYPNTGTFRIGIKLQAITKLPKITLRWWAYRKPAEVSLDK
ncbi:hypothetical protein L9W92_10305 [Pelotomaculum terephthalicicum JT]|uniref:hypothetical protein n=1 Tax=Pelotomaculum terephthalicicum TaxID=206393 RepID=UPI0009D598C2|nr:hypothetical protein [Pelotomaculum terephthalicicum]MCG9968443.1 hypothetical protein [Pelotomaculum terephthalicicum JT]OPY58117.1 MAG: hypothetical protein A4E56_03438 [Pelotomaculum sp. PtaU1.Bin065]